jgi:predicted nucleotidyltransferase/predicted transcriptional regulator
MPILGIKMPKMGMRLKTTGKIRAVRTTTKRRSRIPKSRPSLIDALLSTTQQRVLALLFGQPDRSFFGNELIELTKSGSGGVQRELRRLEDSGLVTAKRIGNQKHFQANHAAPLFHELRSIVLKTVGLAEPLRQALAPLAQRILFASIYGSVAKRTDTAASDVDLLIVSDDLTLEQVYSALSVVERSLARKISPTLLTVQEFQRRRKTGSSFVSKVLAGEHIVLLGNEDGTGTAR